MGGPINTVDAAFRPALKRGHQGACRKMSEKRLGRYVRELAGRRNIHDLDTIEQMITLARGMVGKRLCYPGPDGRMTKEGGSILS